VGIMSDAKKAVLAIYPNAFHIVESDLTHRVNYGNYATWSYISEEDVWECALSHISYRMLKKLES